MGVFKAGNGRWRTAALFYEPDYQHHDYTMFTKASEDKTVGEHTYLSARRLFVETMDPTGTTFGLEYLGGFPHWKDFYSGTLESMIDEWIEEVEARLISEGLKSIRADSNTSSKSSVASAKYLAGRGWKPARKAGAPSKTERERELRVATKAKDAFDKDADRLGLSLVG